MQVGNQNRGKFALGVAGGYSLVELLLVVCIMAMFGAILFPIMLKAKETARVTECLSNMRQIGMGLHMYIDEYNGRFPSAVPYGSPKYWAQQDRRTIQELLLRYVRQGISLKKADGTAVYESAGVFACPSDSGIPPECSAYFGMLPKIPVWTSTGSSYEYYASNQQDWDHSSIAIPWTSLSPLVASANGKQRVGAAMVDIPNPSRKAVLGDLFYWHFGDRTPDNRLSFCNTLFADAHAARVRGANHLEARLQRLTPWHYATEIASEK